MESITKGDLQKKLDYLGLDLDDVPDSLTTFYPLNYNVTRLNNDKDHRVFRFVPIDKIDILITPCLRTDALKDKYSRAVPLHKYILQADNEDDIEYYTMFLKMLKAVSINDIEAVASVQKDLSKKEPYKVKFQRDNMWQIYYSDVTGRFFMLVCSKEETFAEFFYLLKLKIEHSKSKSRIAPKVYVPINAINYSEEYLNRNEIADLENYLWLFTKDWALTFEVYSKTNILSLQITGETIVYDTVKSTYKIKLNNRDEAIKFYKLMKALFILQTEIKNHFNFITKVDSNNGLELYCDDKRLTFDVLTDFIKNEFSIALDEIVVVNSKIVEAKDELNNIKFVVKAKEDEYLIKQKEISTYLEYKKTFFGKVKYFFKSPKINQKIKTQNKKEEQEEDAKTEYEIIDMNVVNAAYKDKAYYTIEDLVTIYSMLEKAEKNYKNINQDLKALRLKLENIVSKVKNATLYIEEIDKHKKSIFDFWKFSNKDEKLGLEMGNESDDESNKNILKKAFSFETDFEDLGVKMDTIQRKKLSKEELDSLFIAKTDILYLLNMLREDDLNKLALESSLEKLKKDFNKNRLITDAETFDIFGSVDDDSRKLKYIGSRGHRENEKNEFKILNINKKIDVFDFTEKLQSIITYLEGATPKMTAQYDFSLYKVCQITEKVKEQSFDVYDLSPERALEDYNDDGEGALNLIKLNYKEGLPLIYYTNSVFYDNNNQTLPVGMNVSSSVFIDCKKLEFELVNKNKFKTNKYFTESNNLLLPKTKDIFVYEYDVKLKNNSESEDNKEDESENTEEYNIEDIDEIEDIVEEENND